MEHTQVMEIVKIGDGESKMYSAAVSSMPYGEYLSVNNVECVVWVGTGLRTLVQNY